MDVVTEQLTTKNKIKNTNLNIVKHYLNMSL